MTLLVETLPAYSSREGPNVLIRAIEQDCRASEPEAHRHDAAHRAFQRCLLYRVRLGFSAGASRRPGGGGARRAATMAAAAGLWPAPARPRHRFSIRRSPGSPAAQTPPPASTAYPPAATRGSAVSR